ncbi:phosphogluconate dehydrogenase (NAD(+)-dependent, decarboxylating) [Actinomycetota bacterium]
MQLGLIGLGKMGGNMRERIRNAGHEVIGYDRNPKVSDVKSMKALVEALDAPRVVWVMVPSGDPTRQTVAQLGDLLEAGDLVIDGGNSRFTDDFENAEMLKKKGIAYLDCGVSGGIWGLENGYGLMVGGQANQVKRAMPIFDALRPEGPREEGFVHAGKVGAGHYAKMVHNGIEYGLMAAYAEGYELLEAKDIVTNVPGAFKAWTRGTVVRSWLLDLLVKALEEDEHLTDVSGYTVDSGEGRWTVEEAIANSVPMPVISASLFARFASRQEESPTMKAVAALRGQFGGHDVMTVKEGQKLRSEAEELRHPKAVKKVAKKAAKKTTTRKATAKGKAAASAGPSSGTGSAGSTTRGRNTTSTAGPTSGTGSARKGAAKKTTAKKAAAKRA